MKSGTQHDDPDDVVNSVMDEDRPTYRTVTDHGLEPDLKLPPIPCTKYTVIGNSKMRVKRDRNALGASSGGRRNGKYWKIPKLVQSALATKAPLEDSPKVSSTDDHGRNKVAIRNGGGQLPRVSVTKPTLLGRQFRANSFDKGSVYSARSEDSFKSFDETLPRKKAIAVQDDRTRMEKKFISRYYRQRSSALLSPIQKKRSSLTLRVPMPDLAREHMPRYSVTGTKTGTRVDIRTGASRVTGSEATRGAATCRRDNAETRHSVVQLTRYHTKPCLYCDVAGQKYCSECAWRHRDLKMKEAFATGGDNQTEGQNVDDGPSSDPTFEGIEGPHPVLQNGVGETDDDAGRHHHQKEAGRRKSKAKSMRLPRIDLPGTA